MKTPSVLTEEITRFEAKLEKAEIDSEEYYKLLGTLEKLIEVRDLAEPQSKFEVKGDTIVLASVNLLGILLVLNHEVLHALPSKALGFITKLRI